MGAPKETRKQADARVKAAQEELAKQVKRRNNGVGSQQEVKVAADRLGMAERARRAVDRHYDK